MKEIDFYNEFSIRLSSYLESYLSEDIRFAYSYNKSLDSMIDELSNKLDIAVDFNGEYVPKLKLDILFGFRKNDSTSLVLFEAKYLKQLALKDYSQLTGYLQVAKNIKIGISLLIVKGTSPNKLSNDFNEIIQLNNLPMEWTQEQTIDSRKNSFITGIMYYQPNNGINWIETKKLNGISSFEDFAREIEKTLETNKV